MSNIPITSLPITNPLTGEETVPIVQAGTTKRTTTGAISALPFGQGTSFASGISFVTVTTSSAALPSSRVLAAISPVTLTDNGTGNTIAIGLSFTPGSGTVTSVGLSGGTTGLTISNSPVTVNGTMTLGGYLNGTAIATGSIGTAQLAFTPNSGTVTQVNGTSTVGGLTLSGGPITVNGTLTLSGTLAPILPQGRLTLTSAVPITSTDVTGATTIYYTPFSGRYVPIYNGSGFVNVDFGGELTNSTVASSSGNAGPTTVSANSVYDMYIWLLNNVTPTLTRSPAWISDTSQGTGSGTAERLQLNGIWVNKFPITNGPGTSLGTLLGSFRSNSSSQALDTAAVRWLSNAYNAVPRGLQVLEGSTSWQYTTQTYRQVNANPFNKLDFLSSFAGNLLTARAMSNFSNTTTGVFGAIGIDIDTLNTTSVSNNINFFQYSFTGSTVGPTTTSGAASFYTGYPGMGRHQAIWKEISGTNGTTTWFGSAGPGFIQSGITGEIHN